MPYSITMIVSKANQERILKEDCNQMIAGCSHVLILILHEYRKSEAGSRRKQRLAVKIIAE